MNNSISLRKRLGLELFRQKEQLIRQKHELHTLFWECTLRCNLACRHCGSDCKAISGQPDMPKEDFLKALDNITPQVDPHRVFIIFTGGEPLMRKDLEECGRACYRREYPWGLVTNGLLLSRQRLDRLLQAGLHSITVSLDGPEDAHNWLRRHPESFRRASQAIGMLSREKEIVWDVVSCINQQNIDTLPVFIRKNFLLWEQPSRIPFLPTAKSLWTWPPGPRKQWNRPRAPIMPVPTGGISSILLSAGVR